MSKLAALALSIVLLGSALSGCSLAGPSEVPFATPAPSKKLKAELSDDEVAERMQAKMEADAKSCRSVARQSGVRSLLAIAKSVNRSNTDKAYVNCMKKKGYKVEGEIENPEESIDPGADKEPAPPPSE